MPITTLRLDDRELRRIERLAKKTRRDKSAVARELLDSGWQLHLIRQYRAGKISIGYLADELDRSIGETMDLLIELGVPSNVSLADVISGQGVLGDKTRPRG